MNFEDRTGPAHFCIRCGRMEEPSDLNDAGECPDCQIQHALDDGDYTAARAVCDTYGLSTPDALGLAELDAEIADRQTADRTAMLAAD